MSQKNKVHFYFSYSGNKYNEMNCIYPSLNLDGILNIVEPFAGGCGFSFAIWEKNKDKNFTYYINDLDKNLFEFYNIAMNPEKEKEIEKNMHNWVEQIMEQNDVEERRKIYNDIKKLGTISSVLFIHRYYCIRPGLFPQALKTWNKFYFDKMPIHQFFKSANVVATNADGIGIFEKYCNDPQTLLFIDPPYLDSYNGWYCSISGGNIYEKFWKEKLNRYAAAIYMVLEKNYITEALFGEYQIHNYEKRYLNRGGRETIHSIYSNRR